LAGGLEVRIYPCHALSAVDAVGRGYRSVLVVDGHSDTVLLERPERAEEAEALLGRAVGRLAALNESVLAYYAYEGLFTALVRPWNLDCTPVYGLPVFHVDLPTAMEQRFDLIDVDADGVLELLPASRFCSYELAGELKPFLVDLRAVRLLVKRCRPRAVHVSEVQPRAAPYVAQVLERLLGARPQLVDF